MRRLLPFWICVVALCAVPAGAFVPCEMQYRNAVLTVTSAHLQQGAARKVQTKLANAWRMARFGGGNPLAQVDQARQLLGTGSIRRARP